MSAVEWWKSHTHILFLSKVIQTLTHVCAKSMWSPELPHNRSSRLSTRTWCRCFLGSYSSDKADKFNYSNVPTHSSLHFLGTSVSCKQRRQWTQFLNNKKDRFWGYTSSGPNTAASLLSLKLNNEQNCYDYDPPEELLYKFTNTLSTRAIWSLKDSALLHNISFCMAPCKCYVHFNKIVIWSSGSLLYYVCWIGHSVSYSNIIITHLLHIG